MYFFKNISQEIETIQWMFAKKSKSTQVVTAALLSGLASVLQASAGYLPGLGFFISPLATAPILLCNTLSQPLGILAYLVTGFLLLIIQPSELVVYPFTTGLLGVGIGCAFRIVKTRGAVIISGAVVLTLGIISLLYGLKFPVLGPAVSQTFSLTTIVTIFLFSWCYSWFWAEIAQILLKKWAKLL